MIESTLLVSLKSDLAASVIIAVLKSPMKSIKNLVFGTPSQVALKQVLERGFEYMLIQSTAHLEVEVQNHVHGLIREFFKSRNVAEQLIRRAILLDDISSDTLEEVFDQLGYDSACLPVTFGALMSALYEGISFALAEELHKEDSPLVQHVNTLRIEQVLIEVRQLKAPVTRDVAIANLKPTSLSSMPLEKNEQTLAPSTYGPPEQVLWERLELAKEFLKQFNFAAAGLILEELQNRHWDRCPQALRAKVFSQLARIKELEGNPMVAARFRGQASDMGVTERERRIQRAYMYGDLKEKDNCYVEAQWLVADGPNTADGWILWVQSAPLSLTYVEIEANVPSTVIEDADVLSALAYRAKELELWDKAISYAREALKHEPNAALAHLNLAMILIMQYEGILSEITPTSAMRASLVEAEQLLLAGLKMTAGNAPAFIVEHFRANRALALRLLGRHGEALEELGALQALQPDEPQVHTDYARLLLSNNRPADAARVLQAFLCRHPSDMCSALLVECHLAETPANAQKALDAALESLDKAVTDIFARTVLLHHALMVSFQVGGIERAETIVPFADQLPEMHKVMFSSEYARISGDNSAARQKAMEALSHVDSALDGNVRRFLARLLERNGLHLEALNLWREIIPSQCASQDTYAFLACAHRCESVADILSLCRKLRTNGVMLIPLYEHELAVLHASNEYEQAIRLTREYLNQPFSDSELAYLRYQLSTLGVITDREELCETNPDLLPSVEDVGPVIGENVVKVMFELSKPDHAMRFAYELYRRYPNHVESHRAMMAVIFYGVDLGPIDLDMAVVGCAVEYVSIVTEQKSWAILEDSPNPDISRWEFGPEHWIHLAILGKKIGETFVLEPGQIQQKEAKIVRIQSKYVFRVQQCMLDSYRLFGAESGVEMVTFPNLTPDQLDLSLLFKQLDEDEKRLASIIEIYRKSPVPLTVVAQSFRKSMLVTIANLKSDTGCPIYCTSGTEKEYRQASAALYSASCLALDSTALGTLILCDALQLIPSCGKTVLISEGVLQELREDVKRVRQYARSEGSLGKSQGKPSFAPANRQATLEWADKLNDAVKFLQNNCEVIGGTVALELHGAIQSKLARVFPHSTIETLAIACRERHLLWADDLRLALVAHHELDQQPRVWTQLVAHEAEESKSISSEAQAELSGKLLELGFLHLRVSKEIMKYCLARGNFDPNHTSIRALVEQIDKRRFDPTTAIGYACALLVAIWQNSPSDMRSAELTDGVLGAISRFAEDRLAVVVILENLPKAFSLDIPNCERCEKCVRGWLAGGLII